MTSILKVNEIDTYDNTASINIKHDGTSALVIDTLGRTTAESTNNKPLFVHHSDGSDSYISFQNNASNSLLIGYDSSDFVVTPNGSERFRVTNTGNVGIGTTSPSAVLDVRDETNGANFIVGGSGTTNITKIGGGAGDSLKVYSNSTTPVATFSTSGNTFLEGSLYLSGETNSANALDDYEEGTWTPAFASITGSYSQQVGYYRKIGNIVHAWFGIQVTGGANTSNFITGLPFTVFDNNTNGTSHSGFGNAYDDTIRYFPPVPWENTTTIRTTDYTSDSTGATGHTFSRGMVTYFTT